MVRLRECQPLLRWQHDSVLLNLLKQFGEAAGTSKICNTEGYILYYAWMFIVTDKPKNTVFYVYMLPLSLCIVLIFSSVEVTKGHQMVL